MHGICAAIITGLISITMLQVHLINSCWTYLPRVFGGDGSSNLQMIAVVVRVGNWVKVAVDVHITCVNRWCIWLELVASHHWSNWSIFTIAIFRYLNLFWWLHSYASIITLWYIPTINQELLRLLILILKLTFLLLVESRLEHHILLIMEVWSDRLVFRNVRACAVVLGVSPACQVAYGFESKHLVLIIWINCFGDVWIVCRFLKHCSWLSVGVADVSLVIWIYIFHVSTVVCSEFARIFINAVLWSKLLCWCNSTNIFFIHINFFQATSISVNRLCQHWIIKATHFPLPCLKLNLLWFPNGEIHHVPRLSLRAGLHPRPINRNLSKTILRSLRMKNFKVILIILSGSICFLPSILDIYDFSHGITEIIEKTFFGYLHIIFP